MTPGGDTANKVEFRLGLIGLQEQAQRLNKVLISKVLQSDPSLRILEQLCLVEADRVQATASQQPACTIERAKNGGTMPVLDRIH